MERLKLDRGLVHVYTGDGKGKTTAALGLCLRVMGWGGRACVVQFIKGYPDIGELHFAREFAERFVLRQFAEDDSLGIDEREAKLRGREAQAALTYSREAIRNGNFDLVVLDEINNAMHLGLVDESEVLSLLDERAPGLEIVLTGRNAPSAIISAADYVTEMRSERHPMDAGIVARKGIDY